MASVSDATDVPTAFTWARLFTFLTVYERGSITVAAQSLHVTAPAVSAAIAALEDDLGTALFARSGRGIVPTEAGVIFAGYCRTLRGLAREARDAVRDVDRGKLRIGAVATAAESVLPPLIASFTETLPRIELILSVGPRDGLFEELGHHEIDVVLAGRPPRGTAFVSRATRANAMIMVRGGRGTPARNWLLRGPGSGTRQAALTLMSRMNPAPPTLTLGTQGACIAAAREGLGLTLVHEDAVRRDLAAGDLVMVPTPGTPLRRPWHVCTTANPSRAVTLFLRHITNTDKVGSLVFQRRTRALS